MKRLVILGTLIAVAVFLVLNMRGGSAEIASAAPSASVYELAWYTVDGGGAMNLTGGAYTLSGTAGQPDAGMQSMGSYTLIGGFWPTNRSMLYLPLILR